MSGKFMKLKKVIVPAITCIVLASQLVGCAVVNSNEMLDMIDTGKEVVIELHQPSYEVSIKGEKERKIEWIQLDQLTTFREFRQDFDTLFNINIVREGVYSGKSGCLYVDQDGDRNGNSTLMNAFRNKVFIEKYWNKAEVRSKMSEIVKQVYSDVDGQVATLAALNAYYNLLDDKENPNAFNPTEPLKRDEFYSLVYRAITPVHDIRNTDVDTAAKNVGGNTDHLRYAMYLLNNGFITTENSGGLNKKLLESNISRAEAIYLVVNTLFKEDLSKVTGKEKAFNDTKNAGDLALKMGFRVKAGDNIINKFRWDAYTIAYMLKHPSKGMQEELYKAMVIAKQKGLITGEDSRWDEPINKAEAIELLINSFIALNKDKGYLSKDEYGKVNVDKIDIQYENVEGKVKSSKTGEVSGIKWSADMETIGNAPIDRNAVIPSSGLKYGDVRDLVDRLYEVDKERGFTEEEIQKDLEYFASLHGTTLSELARVPGKKQTDVKVQQVVNKDDKTSTKGATNTKGATSTKPAVDTQGTGYSPNGINDWKTLYNSIRSDGIGYVDGVIKVKIGEKFYPSTYEGNYTVRKSYIEKFLKQGYNKVNGRYVGPKRDNGNETVGSMGYTETDLYKKYGLRVPELRRLGMFDCEIARMEIEHIELRAKNPSKYMSLEDKLYSYYCSGKMNSSMYCNEERPVTSVGTKYYKSLDDLPKDANKNDYVYVEGKGWTVKFNFK
ncbi:MAG: hypothetical protein QXD03_02440 [Candidatus Anstonellales archaeon]